MIPARGVLSISVRRTLAVLIPTLDEAERLPLLLEDLAGLDASVIVADGGSTDGTRAIALGAGARVVDAQLGRGHQLRAGARSTDATWLFFVHADSRIPSTSLKALSTFMREAREDDFACFRFALEGERFFYRFLEFGQRLRERGMGLAYGDQGLIVSRALYQRVCGHPEWPILEDVGILERLRRHGRLKALRTELVTSPRRYESEGRWLGWLRNAFIIGLYRLGVSPERLARRFPRQPSAREPSPPRRAVIVFAKAPRPGYVKTRLAADVGAEEAVRIYRTLGRATVAALRGGEARLFVYYDPPDDETVTEVSEWLGSEGVEYRRQRGDDLGSRMEGAFAECRAEADEVCIVGTDIPGIGTDTVGQAFRALEENDVVVGPATDGGYYLLALRSPMPELFRDVPWSTDAVLEVTLDRAAEIGARVKLLEPKADVDTALDVPPELLTA